MVRLIGFCLLAAVMTMLLRQMNPGMAALLCVAFGTMTLLMLLPAVGEYAIIFSAALTFAASFAFIGREKREAASEGCATIDEPVKNETEETIGTADNKEADL